MNSNYLNQSHYQNVPSSQVNWAELAQRWIMAKAPTTEPCQALSTNFGFPLVPPQPLGMRPPFPLPFPPHPMPINAPRLPPPGFFGAWPSDAPAMPPPPPFMPPGCFPPPNAFQQNTDNEEYKAHYDASLEQDDEPPQEEVKDVGSAPDGAMSHWFSGYDEKGVLSVVPSPPDWMMWANMPSSAQGGPPPNFTPIIDYQMRKKLPAWILEGLEKAEIEKQKKLQKEKLKKKQEEAEKAKKARRAEKGRGKFDSDSESDEEGKKDVDNDNAASSSKNGNNHSNNFPPNISRPSSIKDDDNIYSIVELTLEERKKEALMAMRRLMTMVLLEATEGELMHIAKECLARAKRKARPKLLASSDALTALSTFGGDDDDDEDNEETRSKDSESDTERNFPSRKKTYDENMLNAPKVVKQQRNLAPRHAQNLATFLRPPTPDKNHHSYNANKSSGSHKQTELPPNEDKHRSSSSRLPSSSSRHRDSYSSRHSEVSRHRTSSSSKSRKSSRRSVSPKELKHKLRDSCSPPRRHGLHSSSSSKKKKR